MDRLRRYTTCLSLLLLTTLSFAGHYSPLQQIDAGNVADLQIAWRRPALDPTIQDAYPDIRVTGTGSPGKTS